MRTGKISETILKRSVLKYCRFPGADTVQGAGAANDSALFDVNNKRIISCAVHSAAIESSVNVIYSVEHALNNLACSGCLPSAVLVTILLPPTFCEEELKELMNMVSAVCGTYGIGIAGGHTEVTAAVNRPVLQVTALGFTEQAALTAGNIRPGMDLLMTGYAGMEGTSLLARAYEQQLLGRFTLGFVEGAKKLGASISVLREAREAAALGAAALHDVSQGGVFGALWEMCQGGEIGLEADLRRIPIRQETIEVCEYIGCNPYCLISGGALLIAAQDGESMARELGRRGIEAAVIGKTNASRDRVLKNGEERRFLSRPAQDEIYRVLYERGTGSGDECGHSPDKCAGAQKGEA
ncbi:MAG: AIR synthase-related protein [Eubacteriales bacterium]|nr:AIR synthase-related protein [Eubacteriales bacterium]